MAVLVTGGLGYIGSHIVVELLDKNEDVIVIDNLSNSSKKVLEQIKEINPKPVKFYQGDILDKKILDKIFKENNIDSVIHLAGLKSVNESINKPLYYYDNNVNGTINLLDSMNENGVKKLIFSSSATVYGNSKNYPITEEEPKGEIFSPYGKTKDVIEEILKDLYTSDNKWNITILRYFNPIGAHSSGLIGENPKGIPNNLFPYLTQVAVGNLDFLNVFGNDYNTPDGTGIRDYIHVVDLAKGHLKALDNLNNGLKIYNLGTGKGTSVLEVIEAFEKSNNIKIDYKIKPRREGDIEVSYCDASKALKELNWKAEKNIEDMCKDAWRWQLNYPDGLN